MTTKQLVEAQKQAHDALTAWISSKNKTVKTFGIGFYEEVYISYNTLIDTLDKGIIAPKKRSQWKFEPVR